jgi:CDP-4-dehydro-6-deoxyglucose reductase, E1
MWKLQENALDKKDLLSLSKYILKSPKLTQGKEVKKFENKFSNWNSSKYSILVNSGSSANLIMIYAAKEYYKWKNQDEIIVPSLTWPTTVNPVIQAGLKPIFVDTNFQDLSLNYEELKKKINKKTKAIFLAHILGFPADVKKIKKMIIGKNIKIFEDCCESIGAKIKKKKVGNFGVAGSFSFYWGHHISTIEGGMITTNDKKFYNLCKMKRSHGFARELDEKEHKHIKNRYKEIDFNFLFLTDGFNLRSTNLNAFLGIRQIAKLNKFIKIRNNNFMLFNNLIKKYKKHFYIINQKNLENISSFSLPLIFKNKSKLLKTKNLLIQNKVEYRPIISGDLTKQPYLKKYKKKKNYYSNIINSNGIYLGNNQFVNFKKLKLLNKILSEVFC